MNNTELFNALSAAARAKGSPLSDAEKAAVVKGQSREYWRVRFLNVIKGAGYRGEAPESICAVWLDKLMQDMPKFEAMLVDYEQRRNRD